jgi:3-hydroxy-3-methylglutaryl CoA synthase/uncharacterized OB-fold protein
MSGIINWAAYVPPHRLTAATLAGKSAKAGDPERAVAWVDEDSITMAVDAARLCLAGRVRDKIDLLIFATTTHAFAEKQGAALIASVLGLSPNVRTLDVGHSLRGGIQALQAALDSVAAGQVREALVLIADCREGAPGSELERSGGDAAVGFLVGKDGPVAKLKASARQSEEIVDVWRRAGDCFTHSWEERFTTQYGYLDPAIAAGKLLRDKADGADAWRWAVSAPNQRAHGSFAAAMKLKREAMAPAFFGAIGACGAAHAPLIFAGALDEAKPGDKIVLLAYGDGADALLFQVTGSRHGGATLADAITRRIPIKDAATYRRARNLDATEYPAPDDQGISATVHFRERAEDLRLQGQRCACGEAQFPKGRVCIRCGKPDRFTPEDFAERGGALVTFTLDSFFPSPTPPTAVGIVQIDNGPRIYLQVAELPAHEVALGMRLRFALRRIHQAGRRPNYFWKALPERSAA